MKHLVLGPGAMGYFMYLGALSALSNISALNELETICGSSAGGLAGFIYLAARGNVTRMLDYSMSIPIKSVMKPNIKAFLKSYGLVSSKKIRSVLEEITRTFIRKDDVTFAELYAHFPVTFHVAACCVDLHTTHYFSVETTPTMSVLDALCMTVAIPFLIQSVRHGGWHYIDGGALESAPCGPLIGKDPKTVLVLVVGDEWKMANVKDFKSYAVCMIGAAMKLRHAYPMFPTIGLCAAEHDVLDFGLSSDTKLRMFMNGVTCLKKSLCKVNANDPACCIHTTSESQDDPCGVDTDASGVQLPSPGVDRPCSVDHDPEPGSAGSWTPRTPDTEGGDARDVGLLDGGIASDASPCATERDQQGSPTACVGTSPPPTGRALDEAQSEKGVGYVPGRSSLAS
jgi:predicted acylesterase/phospholipase RssA